MVPYFTPGNWMLPSTSCSTLSSYESSPLPWDSDQSPEVFVDNAAFDIFSNSMALERLLPPPLDPGFQQATATEIPELAPSASSIEDTETIQVSKSRSKKPQQQEPISPRKPTASLKTPKGKKGQRKTKATLKKGSKEASKGGRGALAAVEEDNFRRVHERNRLAAEKCRRRKRDEALTLAAKEEGLESQNQYLVFLLPRAEGRGTSA
ncbi:Transcription factor atf21 [Fusarium albosuccineum]|uniref:Transcription factor atf21 n=1 Tax=Fusarium albosuccineum TaxID=1237068 RepID=A0A8H4KXV9_9HYPO|nr:Transcription factor atf21 [Fusarium albosuccineum]